jgi:hypothetical protein
MTQFDVTTVLFIIAVGLLCFLGGYLVGRLQAIDSWDGHQ